MKENSEKYQTIGIICWGLMGDVLMRTPVLHALRQIFPEAKIIAIVDPIGEEVLRYNPDIDATIIFYRKRKPIWKYLYSKLTGYSSIKKSKFDLLIDLYSGRSSSNILLLSGVKDRIGFSHSQLQSSTYTVPFVQESYPVSTMHITKSLLKIISPFGYNFESYSTQPIFKTRTSTDIKMEEYLSQFQLAKPYLLNFGSGGVEKILSMEKSFQQVKCLYKNHGYTPLIICNPGQERLQKLFMDTYLIPSKIPYGALDILTLEEIGAMMKLNHFIITPDTGLYHIAVAIGIPIIGIFTYTDPRLVEPDRGLYIHCFQPTSDTIDAPIRFGKRDLDTDYLIECTEKFIKRLEESTL